MKNTLLILISLLFLIIARPAMGVDEWRTFESPEGDKSFTAKVMAVDAAAGTVTVIMQQGNRQLTFPLARLRQEDQEYAKKQAQKMAANRRFNVGFNKITNQTGKTGGKDTITQVTSYDGFYEIKVGNFGAQTVRNTTVKYLIIWKEDSTSTPEPQIVHGSQTIENIFARASNVVTTKTVPLKATLYSSSRRRTRDTLIGCVVQIRVDDQVVLTQGSSPAVDKYRDSFDLIWEEASALAPRKTSW